MSIPEAISELKQRPQWVGWSRAKIPISPHGTPASTTDPATWGTLEEAKFVRSVQGLPGVGFVFSADDPYVGVDLDNAIDPTTDQPIAWAREIVERLNSYTELSPSGLGLHIWCRGTIPRNGARKALDTGHRIEVYQAARYFTVTGKHLPGTPTTIEERSDVLATWFDELFVREGDAGANGGWTEHWEPVAGWEAPDVETWLDEALTWIDADDYDVWVRVGMAVKNELGDRGFGFWDRWSKTSTKYPGEAQAAKKWRSFAYDGELSLGTVVWMAERAGYRPPRGGPSIPDSMDGDWEGWLAAQEGVENPAPMQRGLAMQVVEFAELYADDSPFEPDLIAPGVLGAGDLMVVFGPPKSMKSMAILDMFRQFALGESWLHLRPERPLSCFYAQFENKRDQVRRRVQLAELTSEQLETMRDQFWLTERFTPHLTAEFVTAFAEQVLETLAGQLDVLVLDPLANIYTGDNENDNAQMARFVRQVKLLRNTIDPEVAVVLVHHAAKMMRDERRDDPFQAMRGASALRGAYDTGVFLDRVSEDSTEIRMHFELRNGPRLEPLRVVFQRGRFVRTEDAEGNLVSLDRDDAGGGGDGNNPMYQEIEQLLRREAAHGRIYTGSTFAERFAGGEIEGSVSRIRRHLRCMAVRGRLAFFHELDGITVPALHHRSQGYLCCPGMMVQWRCEGEGEEVVQVEAVPSRRRDAASGRVVACDGWEEVKGADGAVE